MRVVVIGAGIAGLVAARELTRAGAAVLVIERGEQPGGRLATRRIGDAAFDQGAQFFTVRTPDFAARVEDWVGRGLVTVWNHGFGTADGHPRYVAPAGMDSLARDLAAPLEVEYSTMAFTVRRDSGHDVAGPLRVVIDDGSVRDADAVVATCPLPQSFSLLLETGIDIDDALFGTDYDRTVAVLATLDRPPATPPEGGLQHDGPVLSFVGDNVSKGVSSTPALTLHATPAWSETHWDDPDDDVVTALVDATRPWLGDASVTGAVVKRWRFATPRAVSPDACWMGPTGDVVVAGDAFAGPRVEGAHNSGLAAGRALAERLRSR